MRYTNPRLYFTLLYLDLVFLCPEVAAGLVVEYRTCNREVADSTLTRSTASKLLTYCVLRRTQPPTHCWTGKEYLVVFPYLHLAHLRCDVGLGEYE